MIEEYLSREMMDFVRESLIITPAARSDGPAVDVRLVIRISDVPRIVGSDTAWTEIREHVERVLRTQYMRKETTE